MKSTNQFSPKELEAINIADDLKISPFREDHVTYGTPTWIWAVAVDGNLYVRAYSGTRSRWYQAAIKQLAGRIHAAGMVKDVSFEAISDTAINEQIDMAYQAKYAKSQYLPPMISERAKAATVQIIPL